MDANSSNTSELRQRLDFIGIDQNLLKDIQPVVRAAIGPALDAFYAKVKQTEQLGHFFRDDAHMASAKAAQQRHWETIISGNINETYVEGVTRIGKAHARIGLSPRWYIGAYARVIDSVIQAMFEQPEDKKVGRWDKKAKPADNPAPKIGAFVKAALLDMDYAISVYLQTLADERARAEEERLKNERDSKIALETLGNVLKLLAESDLEARMPEDMPGAFQIMAHDYNVAVEALRKTLAASRLTSEKIVAGIQSVNENMSELSERSLKQAASLEESSAALQELNQSVSGAAENVRAATQVVSRAQEEAKESETLVTRAVQAMDEIENSSDQIARIIGVIDEIAFQTNLLALNASVEAARAGDAGKGFAVVAQEVRALAQRSANSAREIKDLISTSQDHVKSGVTIVKSTGSSLSKIIERIAEMNDIARQVEIQSREQAIGLGEISNAVDDMDKITQNNTAMAEATAERMQQLNEEALFMAGEMKQFKVRDPNTTRNTSGFYRRKEDRMVDLRGKGTAA